MVLGGSSSLALMTPLASGGGWQAQQHGTAEGYKDSSQQNLPPSYPGEVRMTSDSLTTAPRLQPIFFLALYFSWRVVSGEIFTKLFYLRVAVLIPG